MPISRPYKFIVSKKKETIDEDIRYEIKIGPTGFRRCKPLSYLCPYLYGSEIIVRLQCKPEPLEDLRYEWVLYRWDGQHKFKVNNGNGKFQQRQPQHKLPLGYLSVTGHHILDLRAGIDLEKNRDSFLVYNFTVMDRDIWLVDLTQKLLIASIGFVVGIGAALLTHLGGWR